MNICFTLKQYRWICALLAIIRLAVAAKGPLHENPIYEDSLAAGEGGGVYIIVATWR